MYRGYIGKINADIFLIFIADILKALTGRYLQAYLVLLLRYIKIYRGPVLTMENPVPFHLFEYEMSRGVKFQGFPLLKPGLDIS